MRARPRSNKDEVDDEDDDVVDDAIRCKVLGETDDDDFRNKTRAMADIYILITPRATNFAVVNSLHACCFEKERRGKMHHFFFTLLCCFCLSSVVLLYNHHHRLIENKVLRIRWWPS